MAASRHTIWVDFPRFIATSIWRNSGIICSALNRFFGITKLLSKPISINPLGTKKKSRSGHSLEAGDGGFSEG
jgi:hypothetical protein